MKLSDHWQFYAWGSAFFAGLVAIWAKMGIANIPSNLVTLIRAVLISALLIVLVTARGEWISPAKIDSHSLIFIALSALATGLSWLCYFRALQMAPASSVAPIDKLSLVFSVVLAIIFLGEKLNNWQWGGVGLMIIGALLVRIK